MSGSFASPDERRACARRAALWLALSHCAFYAAPAAAALDRYTLRDLGTLPGGDQSRPEDVNNAGEVVGVATTADGENHAFLYADGDMIDLGTLPGGDFSIANALSDSGDIVGYSFDAESQLTEAFVYRAGTMTGIGTLEGDASSVAYDVNEAGQIVGESISSGDVIRAFLYAGDVMVDIGSASDVRRSALAINDDGDIVGSVDATLPELDGAFLYSDGESQSLGIPDGFDGSRATAISDTGFIVGTASGSVPNVIPNGFYAGPVRFADGSAELLFECCDVGISEAAHDVNADGVIVGYSTFAGAPWVWDGDEGALLQEQVTGALASYVELVSTPSINDRGQIVVTGVDSRTDEEHAYLLTPVTDSGDSGGSGLDVSLLLLLGVACARRHGSEAPRK